MEMFGRRVTSGVDGYVHTQKVCWYFLLCILHYFPMVVVRYYSISIVFRSTCYLCACQSSPATSAKGDTGEH